MFQLQLSPDMISKLLGVSVFAVILLWLAWLWINSKFKEIKETICEIKKDVTDIKKDFVTCKSCTAQHDNLNITLKSMDSKLDRLIEKL